MDATMIEEINKTRIAQGMKPLPVPGAATTTDTDTGDLQFQAQTTGEDGQVEEPGSTLETREAAAFDNFQKLQDEQAAKKKRDERSAAIRKAADSANRFESLKGKGLGDADDEDTDAKAWLKGQSKRQKKIAKTRKLEEELMAAEAEAAAQIKYTSKDLAGINVRHEVDAFHEGEEQILTLADRNIVGGDEDEEEGDALENVELRDREKLTERLDLKNKKKIGYNPLADDDDNAGSAERSILAQYDEEISGKKEKKFVLGREGIIIDQSGLGRLDDQEKKGQLKMMVDLDLFKDDQPATDYLDISEVKVKKPKKSKKKKPKSTRKRAADDDDHGDEPAEDQTMDIDAGAGFIAGKKRKAEDADDSAIVDDDYLQNTLAMQRREALKKRKKNRPEDLARQIRQRSMNPEAGPQDSTTSQGGLVIDDISEFVSNLKKDEPQERKPRHSNTPKPADPITTMENDPDSSEDDQDQQMLDRDPSPSHHHHQHEEDQESVRNPISGIGEEKAIGTGVGVGDLFKLLKDRKLVSAHDSSSEKLRSNQHQTHFKAELDAKHKNFAAEAQRHRERDRASGRLDRMSVREREEHARGQNSMREQHNSRSLLAFYDREYKPNVELKYVDDEGRMLDEKEAFKHLSHQFHGKGSGKGKTDKRLKKIEDERRMESMSVLDASRSVGMSSAAAQQTKKRKEAGVRLA